MLITSIVIIIVITLALTMYYVIDTIIKAKKIKEFYAQVSEFQQQEKARIEKEGEKDIIDDIDVDIPGDLSDVYPDYDDSCESYDEYLALNGMD